MRISHLNRFVYVAITKTASSSVRAVLDPVSCIKSEARGQFWHHVRLGELKKTFDKEGWNWDAYHKFTVVRHPLSRVRSFHKFKLHIAATPPSDYIRENNMEWYEDFVSYAQKFKTLESGITNGMLLDGLPPMLTFVEDEDGKNMLNSFARLESINEDLNEIFHNLGIASNIGSIPFLNSSPGGMEAVSRKALDLVNEKYYRDFEQFSYPLC